MDILNASFDWSLVRSFVIVAETGSLSGAAKRLGISQPTLGRHIQTLQDQLGVVLFERHPKGMRLSEHGARMLPSAQKMVDAFGGFALSAASTEQAISGTVRITASEFVAHHILPEIIADLRQQEPSIQIELVASDTSENLMFREADIALRMFRPTQLDVIAKHLGILEMAAFASQSYLDRKGMPENAEDWQDHDVVGFDRKDMIVRAMEEMGWAVTQADFAVRCDNPLVYWELVRAGCGIGFGQLNTGVNDPKLVRIFPELALAQLPLWIVAPRATRHTARVARVWQHLEQAFMAYIARFP